MLANYVLYSRQMYLVLQPIYSDVTRTHEERKGTDIEGTFYMAYHQIMIGRQMTQEYLRRVTEEM